MGTSARECSQIPYRSNADRIGCSQRWRVFALLNLQHESPSLCFAAIAASDVGWIAGRWAAHPEERTEALHFYRNLTDPAGGPLRGSADEIVNEISEHAKAWDYLSQVSALRDRAVLLVAMTRDSPDEGVEMHAELAAAIRKAGGKFVRVVTFDDDHLLSSHRIALADTVTHWLQTDCAKTQVAGQN